ncbi:hypothetical protein OH77DRAFT_195238 [Trametes cingulata]|nr:hypothetical protein OH77DRAFT_195238 [Trametes cingulata]
MPFPIMPESSVVNQPISTAASVISGATTGHPCTEPPVSSCSAVRSRSNPCACIFDHSRTTAGQAPPYLQAGPLRRPCIARKDLEAVAHLAAGAAMGQGHCNQQLGSICKGRNGAAHLDEEMRASQGHSTQYYLSASSRKPRAVDFTAKSSFQGESSLNSASLGRVAVVADGVVEPVQGPAL